MNPQERKEAIEEKKAKEQQEKEERKSRWALSDDWKMVREGLVKKILSIDSCSEVVEKELRKKTPLPQIKDILYNNAIAVQTIVDWIDEIETLGGGTGRFMDTIQDEKKDQIIVEV